MALLDFQTALGRLVRVADHADPLRRLRLAPAERSFLEALPDSAGFRFTVAVQRSWCVGRAAGAATLTISVLPSDLRQRLLDRWTRAGGGTSSFVAAEADALLDFIAGELPNPSHLLAACRFEQAALRASAGANSFVPPEWVGRGAPQFALRRGSYAGAVGFHSDPHVVLSALIERTELPPLSPDVTTFLFAPGLDRLWQPASAHEVALWTRLTGAVAVQALLREGYARETIDALLQVGAIEYARPCPAP
jgi:hypothetical protein